MVVCPLVEPAGHRRLQAVDLGSQSGVPGDLPQPRNRFLKLSHPECQLVSEAVDRHAVTLRISLCQILQNGAWEVLNARVDCHLSLQFRIEWKYIFEVSLEVGPVSASEVRAIRWVVKGWATRMSMRNGRWPELSAEHEVRYIGNEGLVTTMSKTSDRSSRRHNHLLNTAWMLAFLYCVPAVLPGLLLVSWQSCGRGSINGFLWLGALWRGVLLEQVTDRCAVWLGDCCLVWCAEQIRERDGREGWRMLFRTNGYWIRGVFPQYFTGGSFISIVNYVIFIYQGIIN